MLYSLRFKRHSRLPADLQNGVSRNPTLSSRRAGMSWHRSPVLSMAVIAIAVVVGWTLLLTGGITGQSFGFSSYSAPSPRTGPSMKGFDFGPYAAPYDKRRFLEVQELCSPDQNTRFKHFPPDQHECCRSMCNDACNAYNDARPGTCLMPCIRGCTVQSDYQIT